MKFISIPLFMQLTRVSMQEFRVQKHQWYEKSLKHWQAQSADWNGVMGGYESINSADIADSEQFLIQMRQKYNIGNKIVLDVGGGVGRVAEQLLVKHFQEVHLVDREERYVGIAKEKLDKITKNQCTTCALDQFTPDHDYDCIWVQWICLYLTDDDLVQLLQRLKKRTGYIILKENIGHKMDIDEIDGSVTRSLNHFKNLIYKAGLKIVDQADQKQFSDEIYPVKMFCLQ